MASGEKVASPFLSSEMNSQLTSHLKEAHARLTRVVEKHPLEPFLDSLYQAHHPTRYDYMPDFVLETCDSIETEFGRDLLGLYNKTITLYLISRYEHIIKTQRLPLEFQEKLPGTLTVLCEYLQQTADRDYVYPEDFYLKDIRILTGRAFSYGSTVLDHGVFLPKTIYRNNGWAANLKCLWYLITKTKGMGPFYRWHIDVRLWQYDSDEARNQSNIDFQILLGKLLTLNPEVRGLLGSGWLEDPQLLKVSPRFTDYFRIEDEQGAFRRCDGSSEETTRAALKTSKTRREAWERGEYRPVSYTVITARSGIINWANRQARSRAH